MSLGLEYVAWGALQLRPPYYKTQSKLFGVIVLIYTMETAHDSSYPESDWRIEKERV